MPRNRSVLIGIIVIAFLSMSVALPASAQKGGSNAPQVVVGSAFTYQGQLTRSGSPYTGTCNFTFTLYDIQAGGTPIGASEPLSLVVTNGVFTALLNGSGQFGPGAFDGNARWLAITVQCPGDIVAADLGRQQLTVTPYASYALKAANADTLDGLHAADIPAHGSILLGAPGDSRLTGAGYQAFGNSNVECKGCDGFTGTWTSNLSNRAAPAARYQHSTVWTGSEMIVWSGVGATNDGFRYNPSTDNWTPISTVGAPSPRDYHTAIWTGSEMIVWGGKSGNAYYADGARYNLATNSWTAVPSGPLSMRARHNAVWTGSLMVIHGGFDGTNYLFDLAAYNPATNSWVLTWGTPYAGRELSTMVWSGDNVIVFGGHNASGAVAGGFWVNPITDAFQALPVLNNPPARYKHTAVWTGSDMIVWGGVGASGDLNDGYRYNEASDKWTKIAASPLEARDSQSAVWTGSEMIVWGGRNGNTYYSNGARYNPATDTWTLMADGSGLITGRSLPSMVWTGNQMIIWGGFNGAGLGDGALYNLFLGLFRNP